VSAIVKAAAVQISPVLYSRQGTIERIVKKVRALGKQGIQFATFTETIVPYYPYFCFLQPSYALGSEYHRLLEQSVTDLGRGQRHRGGGEGGEHGRLDWRQ
jgi:aliphatic nitrilase